MNFDITEYSAYHKGMFDYYLVTRTLLKFGLHDRVVIIKASA